MDLMQAGFRKSSYSEGGGCVEAAAVETARLIRDSKNPDGGYLTLDGGMWGALLAEIKRGVYDL
ncbi:DUF397 domain-containing protein [Actinomadura sp. WMMB 499]|uniref:DUF397 domain-containing protein n=1 Tax=Actinomadura sp. WMMB 499 TaxID=1219491 RepID=UPI00124791A0|nr:DUF397 domain-containing protein [Actinomadura sp. WMMB 499]QFG26799.1 DUF397 domain-containing protein [Actinomadura sp. WMMB 499]